MKPEDTSLGTTVRINRSKKIGKISKCLENPTKFEVQFDDGIKKIYQPGELEFINESVEVKAKKIGLSEGAIKELTPLIQKMVKQIQEQKINESKDERVFGVIMDLLNSTINQVSLKQVDNNKALKKILGCLRDAHTIARDAYHGQKL